MRSGGMNRVTSTISPKTGHASMRNPVICTPATIFPGSVAGSERVIRGEEVPTGPAMLVLEKAQTLVELLVKLGVLAKRRALSD